MSVAVAKVPTPLLNTPDFQHAFENLPIDSSHLLRSVETVVLPNTKFSLLSRTDYPHIVQVSTHDYPYAGNLYTDDRFLQETPSAPERTPAHRSPSEILTTLISILGTRYIWGGVIPTGIPELLTYYPHSTHPNTPLLADTKQLRGVDCSGLLYFATDGKTPRNTSSLVTFGNPVPIEGLSPDQIADITKPLDLIVWVGHVICVCEDNKTIESLLGKGVIQRDLRERLKEVFTEKRPFVLRRWITA